MALILLDLPTRPGLPSQVGLLWGQVLDVLKRLSREVTAASQAELEYQGPQANDPSIAAILNHLALTNLGYASDLGVAVPKELEEAYGPWRDDAGRLPEATGIDGSELLDRLETSLSFVEQRVVKLSDADLTSTISYGTHEATIRWCLWHVADHHMEHLGQIRTRRRHWRETRERRVVVVQSAEELEAAFAIRRRVFINEQRVPEELEIDEFETTATHVLAYDIACQPVATGRLISPSEGVGKLQRIAVLKEVRNGGYGKLIMTKLEEICRERGYAKAVLDAQVHATSFYERLGYQIVSVEPFLDAGIPHHRMEKEL